ncbi:MAG: carboxypeptidase-like regulatory domain-containing protein [Capnocytophaga sp.]|nr:carboxypeptidase-like regulatory domain-containing protein [Capnocytophaga sp.]
MSGKNNYIFGICLIFMLLFGVSVRAQQSVKGMVANVRGEKIAFAVVEYRTGENDNPSYLYTDENGFFDIKNIQNQSLTIKISSLGHEPYKISLSAEKINTTELLKITLSEKAFDLEEVIVRSEKPITERKDTITIQTQFFTDGTEQNVEEMLKKIPGVQVSSEGTIKINDREIEKIMVEGDDFFERGYKILSKNMPAHPVKEIEILNRYSHNRLMKGIENSNKVALNLKLKEEAKLVWFGNVNAGYGVFSENRYELSANLMNFGKQNKYYFLGNLNNTGYDATGSISHLIKPNRLEESSSVSIGDGQKTDDLLRLSVPSLGFKQQRVHHNNAEMLSLNAIFNPLEKLKIKALAFFNWDETNFYRNTIDKVSFNNTDFTNTTDYTLANHRKTIFAKLDMTYDISKNQLLEASAKYSHSDYDNYASLLFNTSATHENLTQINRNSDQKINFTHRFDSKKVLSLTARYIYDQSPQEYGSNRFYFRDLFPQYAAADGIGQEVGNQMQYTGIVAQLLNRKENDNLWEIQLGNEYRKDKLESIFSLFENTSLLTQPNDYQNDMHYSVNDAYAKSNYHYPVGAFVFNVKTDVHWLANRLENTSSAESQSLVFVNPGVGAEWKINHRNKIIANYQYNTTNAQAIEVTDAFALTGFRSFAKGIGGFNQLNLSNVTVNYQLGKWSERFFINTLLSYVKNHNFLSTNTVVEQEYTTSEKIRIDNREMLIFNTKADYYFRKIKNNVKIDFSYMQSNYKNIINHTELRHVTTSNFRYGFELRSVFRGLLNYHVGIKWDNRRTETNVSRSFTDQISFIDLTWEFSPKLNMHVQTERYYFGNLPSDKSYYFMDVGAMYTVIDNKLTLRLTGQNLFNNTHFRNYSVSDIGSSTTTYRLLPRFVLLKAEYRF